MHEGETLVAFYLLIVASFVFLCEIYYLVTADLSIKDTTWLVFIC